MNSRTLSRLPGKLAIAVLTIWAIATLNFFLIRFMPGDPLEHLVGEEDYLYLMSAHPEVLEALRVDYGLDGTLGAQYLAYLGRLLRLDLGQSYKNGVAVLDLILLRLQRTFRLILPAVALSSVLGILLGAWIGWREGSRLGRWVSRISLFLYAVPGYCLGMIALMIFCFYLGWAPSGGMVSGGLSGMAYVKDLLWHMALPVGVLTLSRLSYNVQIMRSSMIEARKEDFALVARTKGLSPKRILFRHVLPNAALPIVTVVTMQLGLIVSGSMMIERLFNWDGMGLLIYKAIAANDYPVLQGGLLVLTVCVVLANLLSDLLCMLIDPRIKDGVFHER